MMVFKGSEASVSEASESAGTDRFMERACRKLDFSASGRREAIGNLNSASGKWKASAADDDHFISGVWSHGWVTPCAFFYMVF